jgi:uncharacterized protein (TIGR00255 family)
MILSMTGYGKGTAKKGDLLVETEIKSLNSRYLDLSIKIPRSLSEKEFAIRDQVKAKISRGKLNVNVYIKKEGLENKAIAVNQEALKESIGILQEINTVSGNKEPIKLDHLLSLQNFYFTESSIDPEEDYHIIEKSIDLAIEEILEMKKIEGEQLKKDLVERIINIQKTTNEIENIAPETTKAYYEKLVERAKKLVEEVKDFDDRLNAELALMAEKYDVTEECVRLNSHIEMFNSIIKSSNEAGRKLNFLCQEINREANTINSKSISTDVSYKALYIKEELEKIREQIQNIE